MLKLLSRMLSALLRLFGRAPRGRLPRGGAASKRRPARPAATREPSPSAPPVGLAGVRFEYAPSLDGEPDPGEIVWAWVPYEEDPTRGKDRPVLLLGRRRGKLVGVSLTSKRDAYGALLEIGTGAWDPERRVSFAKLDRLLDVDASRVRREGAVLERRHFDAVVAALQAAQR